jgi:hypothetical protein
MLQAVPDCGLVFNEAAHSYVVDGERVVSVTQVLDPLSGLDKVRQDVLEIARVRGTRVHRMIELYENDDLDEGHLNVQLAQYLDQYKRFKHVTGFTPVIVEGRYFSRRHRYAGTWDLFGHIDTIPWLLDTKSGMVPHTAGLQTAGYKQLGIEAGVMPRTTRRACLDLKPNKWTLTDEYRGEQDLDVFLAQLTVQKFMAKLKGKTHA